MRNFYKLLSLDDRLKKLCIGGIYKDNIPQAIKYPSLLVRDISLNPTLWADNLVIEYEQDIRISVFFRNNDDRDIGKIIDDIMTSHNALYVKSQWLRDDIYNEYYLVMDYRYYLKKGNE